MWDWNHLAPEGWWRHTARAFKLSLLLIMSGLTLFVHMLVPLWMQPKALQLLNVAKTIDKEMSLRE